MSIEKSQSLNTEIESIPLEMYTISGFNEANPEKYIKSKEQDVLIKDAAEQIKEIEKIKDAPEEERVPLIREILINGDITSQLKVIEMILYTPEKERAPLIKEALAIKNITVQLKAVDTIKYALEKERAPLIKESLAKEDIAVQLKAARMIWCVPEEEQTELRLLVSQKIRDVFTKKDIAEQVKVSELIWDTPIEGQTELKLLVSQKIKEAFAKEDIEGQLEAIKMIEYTLEEERAELKLLVSQKIREAFAKKDIAGQIKAIKMIPYALEEERASFVREAFDKGLGNEVIKPPLYIKHNDIDKLSFKRREFDKTGSTTTLIGGPLKDKIIIRHIEPESFIAWQKIYEDYRLWEYSSDFDYVPIEPIQSYSLDKKKKLVDVYSGVLDLNFKEWKNISGGMFNDQLKLQRSKICEVLDKVGIKHGHSYHDGNFVLRFFRDKNGNPDITKVPRLYLIDFDQAVS